MQRAQYLKLDQWTDVILAGYKTDSIQRNALKQIPEWRCPHCLQPVNPHLGMVRAWHFAHLSQAVETHCLIHDDPEYNPESLQHISMKKAVTDWAANAFPEAKVTFEKRLENIGRIADVFIDDGALRLAVECQWSSIDLKSLEARTNSYLNNGIEVIWVLTNRQNTDGTIKWLISQELPYMIAELEERHVAVRF